MRVTTTFTTDPGLVMRSYRACHGLTYTLRWAVCLGAVALGLLSRSWVLVAAGVAVLAFGELSLRSALKPYLDGPHEVAVTVTDDEYRTVGPDRERTRPWTSVRSVRRVGEFWVMRQSAFAAVALPAAALDDEQTAAFVDLVSGKGLLRKR